MNFLFILFLEGCLIGFSIAMPVGPIGMLCIRNSLNRGMGYGLATGLGAACADTIFGALGAFGMVVIGNFLIQYEMGLKFFGSLFLCYLGASTFLEKTAEHQHIHSTKGYFQAFFSTFLLTLANPMTLLSFTAIYASLGICCGKDNLPSAIAIISGVFVGSSCWWLFLSSGSAYFRSKLNGQTKHLLHQISGSLIFICGILIFATLFFDIR